MKKRGVVLFFLFSVIFIFSFISASFAVGELTHSIDLTYGPEATLRGWINMSFENEPSNSTFNASFENSDGDIISSTTATLKTLLNADSNFNYDCDLLRNAEGECVSNYDASDPATTKTIILDVGESVIWGFQISGNVINGFSLDIDSDAGISNVSQFSVDILNDGKDVWQFNEASGMFRDETQGCYENGDTLGEMISLKFCEKITLSPSPNVEIGANLVGTIATEFEMSIRRMDSSESGKCEMSAPTELSCIPKDDEDDALNFTIKKQRDYFVCIKPTEDINGYKINSETNEPCGFIGSNEDYIRDFDIFAKSGTYSAVGEPQTIDDTGVIGITDIEEYLDSVYGGDCSNDCIIPIKITSNVAAQTITLSNAIITYKDAGFPIPSSDIYNLTVTLPEITADMQKLKIDSGNFTVPSDYENHTVSLSFMGDEIFEQEISVEKVPKIIALNPTITAANYSTTFIVKVESEKNISSYRWEFGTGDNTTTTSNTTTYKYDALGSYNLLLKVTDVDGGVASKTFPITVGSAELITGILLQQKKAGLANVKSQLKNFSTFEIKIINQTLNLSGIETILNKAETDNSAAVIESNEDKFQAVLRTLQSVEVPKNIFPSLIVNPFIFYPKETKVNIDVLAKITGEDYTSSKENSYIDAIRSWNVGNVDITITYKEITSEFEDYSEPLLKFFEVDVTKKTGMEGDAYIILKNVSGLTFDGVALTDEESGYLYVKLIEESRKLIFATTEDINFIDLPLFVAPEISELSLVDFDWSPLEDDGKLKKWVLFVLIIILLIIVGIVFWVILQAWYKKKYENHLFKNKNNLYNLFNWIESAKKRGLSEKEIRLKLRKIGWSSEQVRYATRKHAGKKTGMPGAPAKKIKEIEKKIVSQGKIQDNQSRTDSNGIN